MLIYMLLYEKKIDGTLIMKLPIDIYIVPDICCER